MLSCIQGYRILHGPAPAYLLRDLIHFFLNRTHLLQLTVNALEGKALVEGRI